MKIFLNVSLILLLMSCNVTDNKANEEPYLKNEMDTAKANRNIVNLNTPEDPQNFYVEYVGNLKYKGKSYNHIYEFIYKLEIDSNMIDTFYYQTFENLEGIDFSDFKIELYPGNATVKIWDKNNKEHIMFYVLENKSYTHEFDGKIFDNIPTVIENESAEYSSETPINFSIKKINNKSLEITFKEFSKVFTLEYELIGNEISKLSFLNRMNGHIYSIDKDIYLKPVKKVSFIDYH